MIKIMAHSVLVVVILLSQLYNSFVVAGYELNNDYYRTELCENQEQPELHCEGKCMLAKQLAVHEESEKQNEAPVLLPSLPLFSQSSQATELRPVFSAVSQNLFVAGSALSHSPYLSGIEHPPRV